MEDNYRMMLGRMRNLLGNAISEIAGLRDRNQKLMDRQELVDALKVALCGNQPLGGRVYGEDILPQMQEALRTIDIEAVRIDMAEKAAMAAKVVES